MHVCLLEINGFRGIQSARIVLEEHSVLLGANNVGKSAIVDALGLVLGRDRLVRVLGDYDFFGGLPTPQSRIQIIATVTGFEPGDANEHLSWFSTRDGGVPLWWDGQTVHAGEQPANAHLCTQIAFVARFDEENLEVEAIRYFYDGAGDPFEHQDTTTVKQSHLKDLGFFLLPSHRTWDRVVSFASELFRRVLRFQSAIPSNAVTILRTSLRNPPVRLEEDEQLVELVGRVNEEINGFIGPASSGLQFRPTGGDIEGVLQALTPHLRGKANTVLPLSKHGSGVISLQTLLLLFEFGRARHGEGENFILAAEEPELHLHPGHHRRLVARIRGISNQSITTTHSPEIAAYYNPNEVLILRNSDGNLKAIPLIPTGQAIPDRNALMRLYTLNRAAVCEALMHQVVLLPEGVTEFHWLGALMRLCVTAEGWKAAETGTDGSHAIGLIPTPDSHVLTIFERMHPLFDNLVPMVDGDGAGDEYVRQLLRLASPPKIIVQLGAAMTLESVITHIMRPQTEESWNAVASIITTLETKTTVALTKALTENKSNWKLHEQIITFIAESRPARESAAAYIRGLTEVATTGPATVEGWQVDRGKSNVRTTVWRWSPS
jgi:putative ATP-dependent endonuclease of the OLD family